MMGMPVPAMVGAMFGVDIKDIWKINIDAAIHERGCALIPSGIGETALRAVEEIAASDDYVREPSNSKTVLFIVRKRCLLDLVQEARDE